MARTRATRSADGEPPRRRRAAAGKKARKKKAPAEVRLDALGDPLPAGALARLGTDRLRVHARSLAWSGDGQRVATGQHGEVRVWDAGSGALLATLSCPGREDEDAERVRFGPSAGQFAAILDGQLRVFDVDAQLERAPRPPGSFSDVAFSPSGAWLAASARGPEAALAVFDLAALAVAHEAVALPGVADALCFAPAGELLAACFAGDELLVVVVDVETGREARRLEATPSPPSQHTAARPPVALACDGERVVAAVGRRLVTWSLADGRVTSERQAAPGPPPGHEQPWTFDVAASALSRDGRRLALRVHQGPLRVVDVGTGELVREVPRPGYDAAAFSPDGERLAYGLDFNRTGLLDLATGAERPRLEGHPGEVDRLWFSPDGRTLRSTGARTRRPTVIEWDVAERREVSVRALDWQLSDLAPDGGAPERARAGLAGGTQSGSADDRSSREAGERSRRTHHTDGELALFYVVQGPSNGELQHEGVQIVHGRLPADGGPPETIVTKAGAGGRSRFVGDGEHALTCLKGSAVALWSLRTGEVVRTFDAGGRHQTYAAVVSPDGATLATGGWEGSVHLWDLATGAHRTRILAHRHGIMKLVFSPDGSLLASAAQDRTACLISMARGHAVRSLKHRKEVFGAAFSADGRWLATGELAGARVWDVKSATERLRTADTSREVAFSPDGRLLAVGTRGPILLYPSEAWEPA